MTFSGHEYTDVRPNFWVPYGTVIVERNGYREFWLEDRLMMAEPISKAEERR